MLLKLHGREEIEQQAKNACMRTLRRLSEPFFSIDKSQLAAHEGATACISTTGQHAGGRGMAARGRAWLIARTCSRLCTLKSEVNHHRLDDPESK